MISVIIPSFNGQHLFEKFLQKNIDTFATLGITDIIVADDASTDQSIPYLRTHFPTVTIVQASQNKGFSATANMGAKVAKEDILFFINNDMVIDHLSLDKIVDYLNQTDIFAVTPTILRPASNLKNESMTYGYIKGGWFYTENKLPEGVIPKEGHPLLWACGGAMFVKKTQFWEMGGFDDIYLPFYVEDLGLSYMAWKRGLRCVYTTTGQILHDHQATIKTHYKTRYVKHIHLRNKYLFIWQHFNTPQEWIGHTWHIIKKIIRLEIVEWIAIYQALKRLPMVKERRLQLKKTATVSNQTILQSIVPY